MNDRERLTITDESGYHHLKKVKQLGNDYASKKVLIQKLGDYENAEEKGELLRVPCNVGDMVYKLSGGEVLEYEVFEIRFDGDVMHFWSYNEEYANFHKKFIFDSMTIGKTVFLTREEAEKVLKGE